MGDTMTVVACAYCGVPIERLAAEVKRAEKMGWKSYCSRRHNKLANPSVNPETLMTLAERAWVRVAKGDGCWEWQGARSASGYGSMFSASGGHHVAHRVIWEDVNGPIPDGLWVLHRCDNPPCCRPDHLFLGTPADNTADMIAKGRGRGAAT